VADAKPWCLAGLLCLAVLATTACGGSGSAPKGAPVLTIGARASAVASAGGTPGPTEGAGGVSSTATSTSAPGAPPARSAGPLAGRVVTVDPGHNGGNFTHPQAIARLVNDGNGFKECDTTGTAAANGYRETDFNWDVALRLRTLLQNAGAHVVMTRGSNDGVGPCITERAAIGNRAHSDAAISIHADGGPPNGSGFAVLVPAPIPSRANQAIIAPSRLLGTGLRAALESIGLRPSTYDGVNGIAPRTNLGGLNLSRVPKVFVEVANMRNAADEAPMERPSYRERVARALLAGIERFLPAG
jgi:N-acetylmuramoyl-L-alanine amidase